MRDERELIEQNVERVVVKPQALEVCLVVSGETQVSECDAEHPDGNQRPTTTVMLPWTNQNAVASKGILYSPVIRPSMTSDNRDALLATIAKARRWVEDIRLGRVASFVEIAQREPVGERYIRQLASLAFVSPRVVAAIVEGGLPADLTVSSLAKMLPHSWAAQERAAGIA
jgi:hypothetical protein